MERKHNMNDHDFLTGLYNRKYFEEEKENFDTQEYFPLSIIIADINGHHSTIISSVMATLYARSQETEEHAERIAEFSNKVGKYLRLSQHSLDELHLFSMLHDIFLNI